MYCYGAIFSSYHGAIFDVFIGPIFDFFIASMFIGFDLNYVMINNIFMTSIAVNIILLLSIKHPIFAS